MINNEITLAEIDARLSRIVKQMSASGMVTPNAQFWIKANGSNTMYITAQGEECPSFYGESLEAMAKAEDWATNMPTLEDRQKAQFHASLAKTIELGKKFNIDVKHVNPLEALVKKIASFVLPAPKKPVEEVDF